MATRTHFHRSRFITLLSELVAIDGGGAPDAFAEKLGQWIPIADAISLRASHNAPAQDAVEAGNSSPLLSTLNAEFQRTRSTVEGAITKGDAPRASGAKTSIPIPQRGTPPELAGAYEPFRRYYVAHQRDMDLKAKPLRSRVRDAAARGTPALRQLAALDAAFDGILFEREAMLLAKVPSLLEKRFKQLRRAHQDALDAAQQEDSTALWLQPGGWMTRFCQEMQAVLLAEWELRLQPVMGLLEALHNDNTKPI